MNQDLTAQSVLFPELAEKPVVVKLDEEHRSSDGGAVLLKGIDRSLGLSESLSERLLDPRQVGKIAHTFRELLQQRVFAIALGHPDANDARELADDPVHKLLLDRDPVQGGSLASQPTLSRFENTIGTKDLYRMAEALADAVIERHRRRLGKRCKRITLDFDPTDDPTHGQQEFTIFHGYYEWRGNQKVSVGSRTRATPWPRSHGAVLGSTGSKPGSAADWVRIRFRFGERDPSSVNPKRGPLVVGEASRPDSLPRGRPLS